MGVLDDGDSFGATATPWCPDIDMQLDQNWRLQIARFGDGYEQRALDGINALSRAWTVTYSNRDYLTLWNMVRYLEDTLATSFLFKDPGFNVTYPVFADEWSVTWESKNGTKPPRGSLTATFRQANGVTA